MGTNWRAGSRVLLPGVLEDLGVHHVLDGRHEGTRWWFAGAFAWQ